MKYWIWMTLIPQIGPVLANRLLEKFKTPDQIFKADEKALRLIKGINNRQIESIQNSKSLEEAEEILNLCKKKEISILTKQDHQYPLKAKILEDAPPILYYQGVFKHFRSTVGIVGARRCTQEVKKRCVHITKNYVQQGFPVVSGMAKGIDACAATVCINEGGYTIAVLGNGVDICYPLENRLISAWSDKLIIIGPGKGSGLLITGDYAKKYGREIEIMS